MNIFRNIGEAKTKHSKLLEQSFYFVLCFVLFQETLSARFDGDQHDEFQDEPVYHPDQFTGTAGYGEHEVLSRKGDSDCSSLSAIATKAAEEAIRRANRFEEYALEDERIDHIPMVNGNLKGMANLTTKVPIETTCTLYEILLETILTLEHARLAFDWNVASKDHAGYIWAAADDIILEMTALLISSSSRIPTVRIIQMKTKKMRNFHSGNKGPNIFDAFGTGHQAKLFRTIFTKALEKALKQALTKEFQQQIGQVWYRTKPDDDEISKQDTEEEAEDPLTFRSLSPKTGRARGLSSAYAGPYGYVPNYPFYNPFFNPFYNPFFNPVLTSRYFQNTHSFPFYPFSYNSVYPGNMPYPYHTFNPPFSPYYPLFINERPHLNFRSQDSYSSANSMNLAHEEQYDPNDPYMYGPNSIPDYEF